VEYKKIKKWIKIPNKKIMIMVINKTQMNLKRKKNKNLKIL